MSTFRSGDSRSKLKLLRYEEFTEYGNKYRKGEIKEDSNNLIFNLMSYNMLSQHLLENHRELYYSSDDRTLEWEFRWKLLLEEIRDAKPDILCMQEVEERHVENYYNQLLNYGYNYIYMKRTRLQVDGCAIYYNQSKFDLDELSRLEYFNRGINCLDRDNIALVARFKPKISSEDAIVVATTHLLYNPRRHDVRLAQTQLLLAEIEKLAYNDKTNDYYPILLTGDFNDTPNSAVFRLITEGSFRYEGLSHKTLMSTNDYSRMHKVLIPNWKGVTDNCQYVTVLKEREKKCELLAKRENVEHLAVKKPVCDNRDFLVQEKCFSTGRLTHNLKFNSVYKNVKENGHLEASTQHNTWITVDYIFYSLIQNRETRRNEEGNLKLLSRLRLPTGPNAEVRLSVCLIV